MAVKTKKKAQKRGNGLGGLRQLPSGKWQWRATVELPNGEKKRVVGTESTKSEAERAQSRVIADAARGQFAVMEKVTVEDYIRAWHALRKDSQAAKYTQGQACMIEVHIVPGLGKKRLATVTPRDLEAFYADLQHRDKRRPAMLGKPLGDSMKRSIHNILRQAFAEAVRHGDLIRNPVDVVRPRYTREAAQDDTVKAWTEEEAARFYAVARHDRRGVAFCFMLATGLRIGETLGLRWENVDLQTGRIYIREALVSLAGKAHRTTPKTARSRRSVPVGGDALAILKQQPDQVILDREAQGAHYVGSDSVFTTARGLPILPDNVYKLMRALCQAAEVPYRGTHVLRHSFISIQGQHGRPVEVISAHVGHARASFTQDRYRTVFDKEREALTLDLSTLIEGSKK
ncbi:tyrosine-type recombinase/integrase [Deinococcus aerophilus]|uniref:Site-specific integrase n=1 Tax=Deinococcus aerophilus TaxID=522488 RepID=A0ABQ2GZY2_9DEIO|nr:tyrosine-type recombinase/integrase [Deinococcus aerophilus]GGM22317.1 site-specific integrase [Deinococcus aerophilus]